MADLTTLVVSDVMTRDVHVVRRNTRLADIAEIFKRHDYSAVPVMDDTQMIGLISQLDFLRAFVGGGTSGSGGKASPLQTTAESIMHPDPDTFAPGDSLEKVLDCMVETRYRSFPVIEDDRLAGIVSRRDIVSALQN